MPEPNLESNGTSSFSESQLREIYFDIERLEYYPDEANKSKLVETLPALTRSLNSPQKDQALTLITVMASHSDKEVQAAAISVLDENVTFLDQAIASKTPLSLTALSSVEMLLKYGNQEQKQKARGMLEAGLDQLTTALDQEKMTGSLLDFMIEYGRPPAKQVALEKLSSLVKTAGSLSHEKVADYVNGKTIGSNPLFHLLKSQHGETFFETYEAIHKHLEAQGLEGYQLIHKWGKACKDGDRERIILMNLAAINDLEASRANAARDLMERQNIVNFARYPRELLLDQFTDKNDGRRRGFIAFSQEDWSGSFYDLVTYEMYEHLYKTLGERYRFELVEISSDKEQIASQMNPNHEIGVDEIAFIEVHGHKDGFSYGTDKSGRPVKVTTQDILDHPEVFGLIRIKEGGLIILASCGTGYVADESEVVKGVGQTLSARTGATVIAPSEPGGIEKLDIACTEEGVVSELKPHFVKGEYDETPVKTNTFVNGKLIT